MYWLDKFISVPALIKGDCCIIIERGRAKITIGNFYRDQLDVAVYKNYNTEGSYDAEKNMTTKWCWEPDEQPDEIIHCVGYFQMTDYWEFKYDIDGQLINARYTSPNGSHWHAEMIDGKPVVKLLSCYHLHHNFYFNGTRHTITYEFSDDYYDY